LLEVLLKWFICRCVSIAFKIVRPTPQDGQVHRRSALALLWRGPA